MPFASDAADQVSFSELEVGLPTDRPAGVDGGVVSCVPPGPSSTTSSTWYAGSAYQL